jgi:hypothetical protein
MNRAGRGPSRREILAAGSAAALALIAGCERRGPDFEGGWVGASVERGHLLRSGPPAGKSGTLPAPATGKRAGAIVVGGGIAGLAAARALLRAGIDDVRLLELEDAAGGNSRGHALGGMRCPLGAHYLPTPGSSAVEVIELLEQLGVRTTVQGRAVYDERMLCHSPQERLFIAGGWREGLLPPIEALPAAQHAPTLAAYRAGKTIEPTPPLALNAKRYPADLTKCAAAMYEQLTGKPVVRAVKVKDGIATEAFVMVNAGVALTSYPPFDREDLELLVSRTGVDNLGMDRFERLWNGYLERVNGTTLRTLPYLALIANKFPDARLKSRIFSALQDIEIAEPCNGLLAQKLSEPCLVELIWSYWHEEAMLIQSINAVSLRFQNRRARQGDPLANMELSPLRPLNNLLWGYIQDEQHRLTVMRRADEYDHEYGLRLEGRAVPQYRTADSRVQFVRAFHNLLHLASVFFQKDDDTTVLADAFPVLNALKEVHLILSQGAHNQFGDLPVTARVEMMMQQWIMARPEFAEFLPTRAMVAYPEPWMDRVDAMKRLQGWSDVNVLHFRDLGVFGEKLLLTVRYGSWVDVNDPDQAKNWLRAWRPEIQGYIHAYRAVCGADVTAEPGAALPSALLQQRYAQQPRPRAYLGNPGL